MSDAPPLKWDARDCRLFIHFDVADHHLDLDTFIRTAESARRVVQALDSTFFHDELGFDIIVFPPEEGTFLQSLGIQSKHLKIAAIVGFLCTPQGEAFVKGLTGETTSHWFEQSGVFMRELVVSGVETLGDLGAHEVGPEVSGPGKASADVAACKVAQRIVTSMTRGILEAEPATIETLGMEIGSLPDAMEARAEFYEACLNDREIKRIGFTPEDDFPIPRNSFPERAVKPEQKPTEEEEPEWLVGEETLRVNSPNWSQDKQKKRNWQGTDTTNHERLFVMEDMGFWERIRKKELHFEGLDRLKVQWAYQVINGRAKNRRVLRVLEFNGETLADPLLPDAINAILGSYSAADASREGPSLLDYMDD